MASKREIHGLADAMALIISPVLIMLLVGSLIFFLVEVLYGGEYSGRLRWTFFFFVFGAVLIARISIELGDTKAAIYAAALGGAAFLGMARFVEFPPGLLQQIGPVLNVLLLVLVWWCARKLTWDCTYIDEDRDASDRSVLEAAGLDQLERPEEWRDSEPAKVEEKPVLVGPIGWLQRYWRYRQAQDKKPHTPGVWVVYFSLAALPIFGLGQALIPPEETQSRYFTFWMMAVYVGSGLGLLMTTAFLGLRRYLQKRNLQIPAGMAGLWLGLGSALIVGFLVLAAILPRPSSETPLVDVSSMLSSKERDASQYAVKGDGKGKGDGAGGDEKSQDAKSNNSVQGKGKEAGKGKSQDDASKGSGDNKGSGGDSGKSDKSGDKSGGDKSGEKGKEGEKKPDDGNKNDPSDKNKEQNSGSKESKSSQSNRSSRSQRPNSSPSRGPFNLSGLGTIGKILKWLVFAVLAVVVIVYILRHGLKFLANFADWAKQLLAFFTNLWASLFGGARVETEPDVVEDFAEVTERPRPFAEFANPFDSEAASRQSPAELVKYSFAALEAWAWEHEKGRNPQETPLEFAQRLAKDYKSLNKDAPKLAGLYARLAYARGSLPEAARGHVEEFWRHLELAHDEAFQARAEPAAADG